MTTTTAPLITPAAGLGERLRRLRRFNALMGLLHLAQGVAMLLVASAFDLPVTASFIERDAVTEKLEPVASTLAELRIGPLIAGFLFLSALAHFAVASPWLHGWYERNVSRGNVFAVNMALQYRKVGRWRDYLYGERAYIVLSLTAKSVLAWQVFAGTLQPA